MNIFITGDSHTGSLYRGLMNISPDDLGANVKISPLGAGLLMNKKFFQDKGNYLSITVKDKISKVSRVPVHEDDGHYDWYGISGPLHLQPIILDRFFYGHSPRPFNSSLLRRMVLERKKFSLLFLEELKKIGVPVFVVEAPRTFLHHPKIPRDKSRVVMMENACREIILERLYDMAVPVIRLPESVLSEDGFMSDFYRHETDEDKHHANSLFGELMIKKIVYELSIL